MEGQLVEANEVAKLSNQKFEDVNRKLKVVEGDLERIIERADEFEAKGREIETQVREQEQKVKETEAITIKNGDAEEKFENQIAHLQEEFKTSDTRYSTFHFKSKFHPKLHFLFVQKSKC